MLTSGQAGLFAAILTAFLIESRKELEEDPQQELLKGILRTLQAVHNLSESVDPVPFEPEPVFININGLWFSSLGLTLSSALGAVLAKGWISKYSSTSLRKTSKDACSRMLRSTRIREWGVGGIITTISLLIQIALLLFFIGLGYLLWDTPNKIKLVIVTLMSITGLFYVVTTFLSMVFPACPLQTPLTIWQREIAPTNSIDSAGRSTPPRSRKIGEVFESWATQLRSLMRSPSEPELQARIIAWTIINTFKEGTFKEAVKALAGIQDTSGLQRVFRELGAATVLHQKLLQYFKLSSGSAMIKGEEWFETLLRAFVNMVQSGLVDECQEFSREGGILHQWEQQNETDHRALIFYIRLHHLLDNKVDDDNLCSQDPETLARIIKKKYSFLEKSYTLAALRGATTEKTQMSSACIRFLGGLSDGGKLRSLWNIEGLKIWVDENNNLGHALSGLNGKENDGNSNFPNVLGKGCLSKDPAVRSASMQILRNLKRTGCEYLSMNTYD
jgi:hypothetical protein